MTRLSTLALLSLFFAQSAMSATWTSGNQAVTAIMWKPGWHGFYVTNYQDPEGCGSGSGMYLIDPSLDDKTVDRLYAMLLLASSTGKTLHIWVDGCTPGNNIPKFTGLQLDP